MNGAKPRAVALVTTAFLLVGTRASQASVFAVARFGGEHGNVTTTNPTALYYNPAGIAGTDDQEFHLFIDGSLALRHATWEHAPAASEDPNAPGAKTSFGKAVLFNAFPGPMAGLSKRFGNWAFGTSFSVPFGGRASWSQIEDRSTTAQFPMAVDGVQRWHSITGALTFIYLTGGVAYRLGRLSLGATGNLILGLVQTTQAKNPVGEGDPDATREGRAVLDVSGKHGSYGLGAMFEAIERRLWLGASYQAQPALGPMTLKGTLTTTDNQGGRTPFPAQFHQALPDIVRVGGRYRASESVELRLFGDYTRWSVMQTQCVNVDAPDSTCTVDRSGAATGNSGALQNLRRYWKDTYGVRAGGSWWFRSGMEVFAGGGYETAAIPDSTLDPGLPDAATVSGALGGRTELGHAWFLAASYTHIYYFDRDNTGKSELTDAEAPTRRADGGGKYTQWVGVFNVNLEKQF